MPDFVQTMDLPRLMPREEYEYQIRINACRVLDLLTLILSKTNSSDVFKLCL